MKKTAAILSVCVTVPIWYYLLFWLLKHAGAGELQWFLFWVYAPPPVGLLVAILTRLTSKD